jgi:hypothetical protein
MKKFFRLNILMQALLSIVVACNGSLIAARSVPAGGSALYAFQEQCLEVLEMVSAEMGDDTTLGERIMQVYGWVLDGTPQPKQYAKERAAFIKECKNEWKEKLSPAVYAQLEQLNATGKKYAGMAGWKKGLIAAGSFAGIMAIVVLSQWDKHREKSKKGPGGPGELGDPKTGWEAVRPFRSPKPPILESPLFATGPRVNHVSPAGWGAGAGARVGGRALTRSVNKRPDAPLSLSGVFASVADSTIDPQQDANLRARVADARRFMQQLTACRYNQDIIAPCIRIALGDERYDDDINTLFYTPDLVDETVLYRTQSSFLSLAAAKGPEYWPLCEALIAEGARTNLGDPLPVTRLRQKSYLLSWDERCQVTRRMLLLMRDLSLAQLQAIFNNSEWQKNYYEYCFHEDSLAFFQAKGCTLEKDEVFSLVDNILDDRHMPEASKQSFLQKLTSWYRTIESARSLLEDYRERRKDSSAGLRRITAFEQLLAEPFARA